MVIVVLYALGDYIGGFGCINMILAVPGRLIFYKVNTIRVLLIDIFLRLHLGLSYNK